MATSSRLPVVLLALALAASACAQAAATPPTMPASQTGYEAWRKAQDQASNAAYRAGDYARVRTIEQTVIEAARKFGDRAEEVRSLHGLGVAELATGQLDQAERRFRQVIAMAGTLQDHKGVAAAQRGLGRVLESRGKLAKATEVQVAALELLLRHGTPMDQSESYYALAKLFHNQQNQIAARHGVDRAIALMGKTPPDFPLGLNLALRSAVARNLGDAGAALADAEAASAAFARAGGKTGQAIGQLMLGAALGINGQAQRGLELLREGEATAADIGETVLRSDLLLEQGVLLVREGRHQEALAPLRAALAIADELALDNMRRDANLELEKAWSGLGRTAEALAASKQAFAAQTRIANLAGIGQIAGRSAESQLAALDSRFMALDPATRASAQVLAPAKANATPAWRWLLPLGLLLAALAWALRHGRRLGARQRDLESAHAKLQDQSEHLRQQVSLDPLTGVLTRRAFADDLAAMLQLAQARDEAVTLMVFDLDHFKAINDQHGHMTGDAALKLLAGLVREQLDSKDLFGRFGGDEFMVACRQPPAEVRAMAERIRASVELRSRAADSRLPPLGISAGLADAGPTTGYDPDTLFLRADAALYAAKDGGRNRVVLDDGSLPPPGDPRSLLQPGTLATSGRQ